MFQQYANAFNSSQTREFLSTIDKTDLPDANTGFDFFGKVVRWMEQDLNKNYPQVINLLIITTVGEWTSQLRIITRLGCYVVTILTAQTEKVSPILLPI